ncbi:uncharacterized protein LOC129729147 [Wyeomyia smithii]|uniref:uncharacterized protein LOC129729147 n=1 Tax=Wyeomyia smithii TaxID=174621 RepID=UPI002467ED5D|nr:uncharacterized protein LOC129729147 [Wyeomyia smithii]
MHFEEKCEITETATSNAETRPIARSSTTTQETPKIVAKCEVPVLTVSAHTQVMLATAVIDVIDRSGVAHRCRALLDSGAMANFISQRISDVLRLHEKCVNVPVIGVNGTRTTVKFKVNATVKSRRTNCDFSVDFLIVPRITGALPPMELDASKWPIPKQILLADPRFFCYSRVDMLIGAEVFYDLMGSGKIRMSNDLPLLQESLLGWLDAGTVSADRNVGSVKVLQATTSDPRDEQLNTLLERFWMIDEQTAEPLNNDCERHFLETYSRGEDGRYTVQQPFRDDPGQLGDSRNQAEKMFKALENRLERRPEMKKLYSDFIHEYLELDHARILEPKEPESSTTRFRVVFNASAKTTNGASLNDILMDAPTVQKPLFDIMLQWRLLKYAFTADAQRTYRQVKIDGAHTKYQRCLWRDDRTQPIQDIELLRVTYGIGPAGFLATRCLNQLAQDERNLKQAP